MLVSETLLLELSLAIDPALSVDALCSAFVAPFDSAGPSVHVTIAVSSESEQDTDPHSVAAIASLPSHFDSAPLVVLRFPLAGLGFLQYEGPELKWLPGTRAAWDRVLLQLASAAAMAKHRERADWNSRRSALVAHYAGTGSWEMVPGTSVPGKTGRAALGHLLMVWDPGCHEIFELPFADRLHRFDDFCEQVDPVDREDFLQRMENFLCSADTESVEMSFRVLLGSGRSKRLFGKLFWLWNGNRRTLIGALHDVTELELARTASLYRSELENLLTTLSMKLISAPAREFDRITQQALADVGAYVGADRSYIFRYDFEAETASNTFEWCAEGIAAEIQNLQGTPIGAIEYWVTAHKRGLPLHLRRISDLPKDHGLRHILEPQGIQSIIALPLMDEDECLGFIGFDAVKNERHWSDVDMALLKLLAQLLVSAERRFAHERQIQKANRKLRKARRHAEALASKANAASEAKSRFVAAISHEIRTPLHAILGFADMLLNNKDELHVLEHIVSIKESGESLLALINDVLDFSRIESTESALQLADFSLTGAIAGTTGMFAALAQQKGITLGFEIDPECPAWIHSDEQCLRQLLKNIVGNAVKFTHAGDVHIHVACQDCSGPAPGLQIAVRDTGIGIAAEHIPHLFDSFFQIDSGNDRVFGGTGLGLTIASRLAKMMGGDIAVSSEPGKGTTFTLHLPLTVGHGQRSALQHRPDERPVASGLRILFAEDNSVNLKLALIHLRGIECKVVVAENGRKAVDSFMQETFDLVLMDCQMPVMDGYLATEMIRAHEASRGTRTPIVAVTASAIEGEKAQCLAAGMDDVLTKPYTRSQLHEVIARWTQIGSGTT